MDISFQNKSKQELINIINALSIEKESLQETNIELKNQVALFKAMIYGKKTEKLSKEEQLQGSLFDEIETYKNEADNENAIPDTFEKSDSIQIKTYSRKRPGRKPIPDSFPREEIIIYLTEKEKICSCGHEMKNFNNEITEKVDIIPAKILVKRYVRPIYTCHHCKGNHDESETNIKTAAPPKQFLPKAIADIGLIAFALISKFCDGLPFYRLTNILKRFNFDISRATLCNYAIQSHKRLDYIDEDFWKEILNSKNLQIDETRVKVLKENGISKDGMSYMFVIHGNIRGKPVVKYIYNSTRSAGFLYEKLKDYNGIIQTDGWKSYDTLFSRLPKIKHAGCWVHVRREFFNILKNAKKHKGSLEFVRLIGKLYSVEDSISDKSDDIRLKARQEESKPIVNEIKKFMDSELLKVTKKSDYGKALKYMSNQWTKLLVFLDHPEIPLDTNIVENAIRPFVIGRKNWLFSGTDIGAEASAFFYSLIETAKLNDIEPYAFLREFMKSVEDGNQPKYFEWVH